MDVPSPCYCNFFPFECRLLTFERMNLMIWLWTVLHLAILSKLWTLVNLLLLVLVVSSESVFSLEFWPSLVSLESVLQERPSWIRILTRRGSKRKLLKMPKCLNIKKICSKMKTSSLPLRNNWLKEYRFIKSIFIILSLTHILIYWYFLCQMIWMLLILLNLIH